MNPEEIFTPADIQNIFHGRGEYVNKTYAFVVRLNRRKNGVISENRISTLNRSELLCKKLAHPRNSKIKEIYLKKIEELNQNHYIEYIGELSELWPTIMSQKDQFLVPTNMLVNQKSVSSPARLPLDASSLSNTFLDKGVNYLPRIFDLLIFFRDKK